MRGLLLLTAIVLTVTAAPAKAGTSLALTGPSSLTFSDPITVPVRAALTLDEVVCGEDTHVPVIARVESASGADASFETGRFDARVGAGAGLEPREVTGTLMLRIAPTRSGAGDVHVAASYALPPACVAIGGPAAGEATLRIALHVRDPTGGATSRDATHAGAVTAPRDVPVPVALAGLASLAGGAWIVSQRLRDARRA